MKIVLPIGVVIGYVAVYGTYAMTRVMIAVDTSVQIRR